MHVYDVALATAVVNISDDAIHMSQHMTDEYAIGTVVIYRYTKALFRVCIIKRLYGNLKKQDYNLFKNMYFRNVILL